MRECDDKMHRKVYVEVDRERIGMNVSNVIKKYDHYDYYLGVVKGNAYGHGYEIIPTLIQNGINYLAVSSLDEAIHARRIDESIPILIMEPVDIADVPLCQEQRLTITVSSYDYWQKLAKLSIDEIKIHLKINTGLNRLGIGEKVELKEVYEEMAVKSGIFIEGIYTHLATTGLVDAMYDRQVERFLALTSVIDVQAIPIVHVGRSATLEVKEKLPFANGVRVGALLYGINQTFRSYHGVKGYLRKMRDGWRKRKLNLSKSTLSSGLEVGTGLSLKAPVIEINRVYQGETVGYGGLFKAKRDTYIATLPVGYKDGLYLEFCKSKVWINGQLYPVVGVVNMCLITVEVDEKVSVGSECVVLGGEVCIKGVAALISSTPYVVMTGLSCGISRVYK